jgi:hypothetical protein
MVGIVSPYRQASPLPPRATTVAVTKAASQVQTSRENGHGPTMAGETVTTYGDFMCAPEEGIRGRRPA